MSSPEADLGASASPALFPGQDKASLDLNDIGVTFRMANGKEEREQESSPASPAESKLPEHDR